jgi:hypothetical protein
MRIMPRIDLPDPSITFTNQRDTVTGSSDGAIYGIITSGTVNTLGGDDTLSGTGTEPSSYGIYIDGTLDTSTGKDTISGSGNLLPGINVNSGALETGAGNDTITGTSVGVSLSGQNQGIFLNANDTKINTGAGNDAVIGESAFGTDIDVNTGDLATGDGNDTIDGAEIILRNGGTIRTGAGNDKITGSIQNFGGTIETGPGNDTVDARDGGFLGQIPATSSVTDLGAGNDDLIGFGRGFFKGGAGKDTLELTSGTYEVGVSGETVSFSTGSTTMQTTEFETLVAGDETYDFDSLPNEILIA